MADQDSNHVIISRQEARERGLKRYFTGKPCKYGFVCERWVANRGCWCPEHQKERNAQRRTPEGRAAGNAYAVKWKAKNPERWDYLVKKSQSRPEYKDYQFNYQKLRRETDIQYRLRHYLGARLRRAIVREQKGGSAILELGCDLDHLVKHLERQFKPGMTWNNYGKKWHIDHIRPLSSFDLTDREQLLEACNYKNLQPLWAKDNLVKQDKDPIEFARSKGLLL
jgi:hypothetical protein